MLIKVKTEIAKMALRYGKCSDGDLWIAQAWQILPQL